MALPEDPEGPNYDQRLRAFNAQEALVAELAEKFVAANYRAKHLFADMLMTPWYRAAGVTDPAIGERRSVELATVGSGRLLTPEELDRKNLAVFGRTWGQRESYHEHALSTNFGDEGNGFKTFYGGTDSAIVTTRNREMTSLMGNVSENMAVDLACQAVGYDFSLPREERMVFNIVDRDVMPGDIASLSANLPGQVEKNWDNWREQDPIQLAVELVGGRTRVFLSDTTSDGYTSTDADGTNADIILQSITFSKDGEVALRVLGADLPATKGFEADRWQNDEGESGWRGDVRSQADGWWMHEQAWVAFEINLPAGQYTVDVQLATSLFTNNINDEMAVGVFFTALENTQKTKSAKLVDAQMRALYMRATNRELPPDRADKMVNLLVEHSMEQEDQSWRDDVHCDWWQIWSDWEDVSAAVVHERFHDPRGLIRGWTMVTHSILSSYTYLHD